MKVVPYNDVDDLEKESAVGIESMSITYIQPADCNSSRDEIQTITLSTQYNVPHSKEDYNQGKEGFYIDVTIPEGQHWSIDDAKELTVLVNDFKQRLYKTTDESDCC